MLKFNVRREASCLALALAVAACGSFGGKSDDKGTEESQPTGVMMQGTLALTSGETAAALTADPYNLYCVTFTDVPSACKIDVATEGGFDHECADFANKTFGCFLRQGSTTLATIEFDLGSALTVGGGSLVMNVSYDPETGMAFAKIDQEASSSLGGGGSSGEKTSIALDGTWKIGCGDAGDSEIGDCSGKLPPEGFDMTFTTFMVGDKSKASMWESPEKRNICVDGGSEALPNFRVEFNGKKYAMDYSSREAFEAKVDAMFGGLAADIKDEIVQFASARGHYEHCSEQVDAESCKLIVPEMVEVSFPDPQAPGGIRTEMHPKFDYTVAEFGKLTEYEGTLTKSEWKCAIDPAAATVDIHPCPPDMKDEDGDGFGSQTHYNAGDKPVMMLCQVGDGIRQMPVLAATKEAAITAATGGKGGECEEVEYAGGEYYRSQVEDIRRAAYELFMVQNHGGPGENDPAKMCDRLTVPDDFDFSKCGSGEDDQPYEICYLTGGDDPRLQEKGLKLSADGKKLVADGPGPQWFDERSAEFTCPIALSAFNTAMQQPNADYNVAQNQAAVACRDELAGLTTAVEQARALSRAESIYRPLGEAVICGREEGDALRTKLLAALSNSCLAEVDYNKMCFEGGQCQTSMVCRGSSNDGKCYSADGAMFAGRINGRDDVMDLKMEVGGAFTLSSSALEKFYQWDQEASKPVACTYARSFIINARKVDDNNFAGIVSQAGKESCEGEESGEGDEGGDEGKGSKEGGGGKGGENFTIPISAARQ